MHGLLPQARPLPIAALAPERTYYLTSTSKTLAPGLRIAYVKAPPAKWPASPPACAPRRGRWRR